LEPHEKERYWNSDKPTCDENLPASNTVGESPSRIVRERLRDAKHDDEGQDRGPSRQLKFLFSQKRQDASLHPDHCADEGVDHDEQ
jgi:hypothetical protein